MSILDDLLESITGKTTEDIAREARQRGITSEEQINQELARLARQDANNNDFDPQDPDCLPSGTGPDSGFGEPGEEPFDESNFGDVRFLSPIVTINEDNFQGAQSIREINLFDENSFFRSPRNLFIVNSDGQSVIEEPFLNSESYITLLSKGPGISGFETVRDFNRNITSTETGYDKFRVIHNRFWMLEGTEAAPIQEAFVSNRNLNQPSTRAYTISFNINPPVGERVELNFTEGPTLDGQATSLDFNESFAENQANRLFPAGTFVDTNTSVSQPLLRSEADNIGVESIIKNSYIIDFSTTVRERIVEDEPKPEYFMKSLYREYYRQVIDPEYKLDCNIADTVQKFISSNTGHIRDANNNGELLDRFPNYVQIKISKPNSIFDNNDDNLANRDPAVSYPLNFLTSEYDKYLIEALDSEPSNGESNYAHFRNYIQIADESSPESLQSTRTNDQFFVGFIKCLKTKLEDFLRSNLLPEDLDSWANSLHLASIEYPLKFENYDEVVALKTRDMSENADFSSHHFQARDAHCRKYSNIFDGQKAKSAIIGYKIEKYRTDNNVKVQTFYVMEEPAEKDAPTLDFIDTQVVYGRTYHYLIYSLSLVFGTQYSFGTHNVKIAEAAIDAPVNSNPYVRLVEAPFFQKTVPLFDLPPLPPEVSFVPNQKNPKNLSIILNHNVGNRIENPIMLEYSDLNKFQGMRSAQLISQGKIEYLSDSIPREYHIYVLQTPPRSYRDFGLATKYLVETNSQKSIMFTDLNIEVNKDYYFTFRSSEAAGVSNPTPAYKFKMVDSANGAFMLLEEYDMYRNRSMYSNLCFERVLKISPSVQQKAIKYPEGTDLSSREFSRTAPSFEEISIGTNEQSIWDKKYKFRITSKNTGRKLDINSVFKVNTLRNDPFFEFTRNECENPEPEPPPQEEPRQDPIIQPCNFSEKLPILPIRIKIRPKAMLCPPNHSQDGTFSGRTRRSGQNPFIGEALLDLNNIMPDPTTGEPMNIFQYVHRFSDAWFQNETHTLIPTAEEGVEVFIKDVDCSCPENPDIPMNPLPNIVLTQNERAQNNQDYIAILDTDGHLPAHIENGLIPAPVENQRGASSVQREQLQWWTDTGLPDVTNFGNENNRQSAEFRDVVENLWPQYFFAADTDHRNQIINYHQDSAPRAMCLDKVKNTIVKLTNYLQTFDGPEISAADIDVDINSDSPRIIPAIRQFLQDNRQTILNHDYEMEDWECLEIPPPPDPIDPGGINIKLTHESPNVAGDLEVPEGTSNRKILVSLKKAPEVGNQVVIDFTPLTVQNWDTVVTMAGPNVGDNANRLIFNATNFSTFQEITFDYPEDTVENWNQNPLSAGVNFTVNQDLTTDPKYILAHLNEVNVASSNPSATFRGLNDAGLQKFVGLQLIDNDIPGFDFSINDGTVAIEWDGTKNNRILNMNIGQVYKIGIKPLSEPLTPAGIALQQEYPDHRRQPRSIKNFLGPTARDNMFSGNGDGSQFLMLYSDPSIHGIANAGAALLRKFNDNPTNDVIDRTTHEDAQRANPAHLAELGLITVKSKPSDEGANLILRFAWKPGSDTTDPDNWQNYKYIWILPKKKPNDQRDELNSCPTIQFKVPLQDDSDDIGKYNRMKVRLRVKFNEAGSGEVNECEPGFINAIDEDGNSVCIAPENQPCPKLVIDGDEIDVERTQNSAGENPTCIYSQRVEVTDEWKCPTTGGKIIVIYFKDLTFKGNVGTELLSGEALRDKYFSEFSNAQIACANAKRAFKNNDTVAHGDHLDVQQRFVDENVSRRASSRITFSEWKEANCPLECNGTMSDDPNEGNAVNLNTGFILLDNNSPFDRFCACPEGTDFAGLRPEVVPSSDFITAITLQNDYKSFVKFGGKYCNNPKKSHVLVGAGPFTGILTQTASRFVRLRAFVEGTADVDFNAWSGQNNPTSQANAGVRNTTANQFRETGIAFAVAGKSVFDITIDDWDQGISAPELVDLLLTNPSALAMFGSATDRMEKHIQDPPFDPENNSNIGWSNHALLLNTNEASSHNIVVAQCNPVELGIKLSRDQSSRPFFEPFPTFSEGNFRIDSSGGVRQGTAKPIRTSITFPRDGLNLREEFNLYPRGYWSQGSSGLHTAGGQSVDNLIVQTGNERAYGFIMEYHVGNQIRAVNCFTNLRGQHPGSTPDIDPSNILIPRSGADAGVSYTRYTNYNPSKHQLNAQGEEQFVSTRKGAWNMWKWIDHCFGTTGTPLWPPP